MPDKRRTRVLYWTPWTQTRAGVIDIEIYPLEKASPEDQDLYDDDGFYARNAIS